MGASCSTEANAKENASGTNSPRLASAPAAQLKPVNDAPAVLEAAKVKLAKAAPANEEPAAKTPEPKASEPAPAPTQPKESEPSKAAPPAADSTNNPAPAGDANQPGHDPLKPEQKFDTLLEQERVKRTRRRSAVGGAAGDFGGQLDMENAGDIHPDVLAMMAEADAAHRAAGLECKPTAVAPAAAEPKQEAAPAPTEPKVELKEAAAVPVAAPVPAPVAAPVAADPKVEAAPAATEAQKEVPAEVPAEQPAVAAEKPHHATFSEESTDKQQGGEKESDKPANREYQRGKTGVTSIHSTGSTTSDKSELDGDNMAEALHDEVSASAMHEAPDSCDNAIEEGNEAAAIAEASKEQNAPSA